MPDDPDNPTMYTYEEMDVGASVKVCVCVCVCACACVCACLGLGLGLGWRTAVVFGIVVPGYISAPRLHNCTLSLPARPSNRRMEVTFNHFERMPPSARGL